MMTDALTRHKWRQKMRRVKSTLNIMPLAACSAIMALSISTLAYGAGVKPKTQGLSAQIQSIAKPVASEFKSISAKSLINGANISLNMRLSGNSIKVKENNGCSWTRHADWFAPSSGWAKCGVSKNWHTGSATVNLLNSLYPIKVGSTGSYKRSAVSHTGKKYTRTTRCKVTGAVEVISGKKVTPAFVVVCNDTSRKRTTWYAPGIGPVAYTEVHHKNGLEEAWVRK